MATNAVYGVATYGSSQYGTLFVTATAGAYTITGNDASFGHTYVVTAAAGAYTLTGSDASLTVSHVLAGNAGSYSLTGYDTTLIHNDVIYAGSWAFNITGYDAGLIATRLLFADAGAYALSGGDAVLAKTTIFACDAGAYSLSGKDAGMTYQPVSIQTTGGVTKKVKTKVKKNQRDEVEAIVREAFDKMDGTYVPPSVVAEIQKEVKREIKQIDLAQYEAAMAQVNALLLQAQIQIHAYESELDDEESLLMLL
jgi:hypothetical protein